MQVLRVMIGDAADTSWNMQFIPRGTKYKIRQMDEDVFEVTYWEEVEEHIVRCEECGRCFITAEEYFCSDECADKYWDIYYEKKEGRC